MNLKDLELYTNIDRMPCRYSAYIRACRLETKTMNFKRNSLYMQNINKSISAFVIIDLLRHPNYKENTVKLSH